MAVEMTATADHCDQPSTFPGYYICSCSAHIVWCRFLSTSKCYGFSFLFFLCFFPGWNKLTPPSFVLYFPKCLLYDMEVVSGYFKAGLLCGWKNRKIFVASEGRRLLYLLNISLLTALLQTKSGRAGFSGHSVLLTSRASPQLCTVSSDVNFFGFLEWVALHQGPWGVKSFRNKIFVLWGEV